MQTGINISGVSKPADPETVSAIASSLNELVKAAFDARLEQSNIAKLLDAFALGVEAKPAVNQVSISNNSVQGDRQFVEVDEDEYEDEDETDDQK